MASAQEQYARMVDLDSLGAPFWVGLSDVPIANTAAEMSCLGASVFYGGRTLKATRARLGTVLRVRGAGIYSTPAVNPGGATVKVKLGSTVVASVSPAALIGNLSNAAFDFVCDIFFRSIGAQGKVVAIGGLNFSAGLGLARVYADLTAATDAQIDTTVDNLLDVTMQWSAASAQRSMTVRASLATLIN